MTKEEKYEKSIREYPNTSYLFTDYWYNNKSGLTQIFFLTLSFDSANIIFERF